MNAPPHGRRVGVRSLRCAAVWVAALAAGRGWTGADAVVFTLTSLPVRAADATVYVLDRRERLAARLGAGLPADLAAAAAEARRRLASPAGRRLRAGLAHAMAGRALAGELGVERLPAVVIGGRWVVYGVRDVRRARRLVADWRRARGEG